MSKLETIKYMDFVIAEFESPAHNRTTFEVGVERAEYRVAMQVILEERSEFGETLGYQLVNLGNPQGLELVDFILNGRNCPERLDQHVDGQGQSAPAEGNKPGDVGVSNLGEEGVQDGDDSVHEYGAPCKACQAMIGQ